MCVCVRARARVCVCMHTYAHTRTHAHTHTHTHTHTLYAIQVGEAGAFDLSQWLPWIALAGYMSWGTWKFLMGADNKPKGAVVPLEA